LKVFIALAGCLLIAGCSHPPIEATADRIVLDLPPHRATPVAVEHCAKFGKRAVYESTAQYRFNGAVMAFRCEQ
jgi:hypothetical protein